MPLDESTAFNPSLFYKEEIDKQVERQTKMCDSRMKPALQDHLRRAAQYATLDELKVAGVEPGTYHIRLPLEPSALKGLAKRMVKNELDRFAPHKDAFKRAYDCRVCPGKNKNPGGRKWYEPTNILIQIANFISQLWK